MRITEIDLQCEDIMWFGIDNKNHIFECTSAGCANVPEFVCRSKEVTNIILNFFMNDLKEFTQGKLLTEYDGTNQLLSDCILLSRKGIYCFDVCLENENQYIKIAEPLKPLLFDELPTKIKEMFCENRVDTDVTEESIICVEHAY